MSSQEPQFQVKNPPPVAKWRLFMARGHYFSMQLPTAPNRFHRLMQRIVLGFRWEEIE